MQLRRRFRVRRTGALVLAVALSVSVAGTAAAAPAGWGSPVSLAPIDPQQWENPADMTWSDYKKPPGTDWANPARKPTKRMFKGALVLVDYPDQPFAVTQPPKSTVFGNPTQLANNIPRAQVAQFYQDFLNKPGKINNGHTINEYWMEDSGGRFGVDLKAFGAYQLPGKSYEYAMEFQGSGACPAGSSCTKDLRTDAGKAWRDDVGTEVPKGFDFVFFLSAGQDESGTWQEFGPMMFDKKEDVPDSFGPPDPKLPNWAKTRYVEWTSWKAAASIWPNAGGGSSTQAESSGQGVYAHEFSHILGIGDNYNNPFGNPPVRAYSGPWDMLSRGTFNGPGGTHTRWFIPPTAGASMGAQHMLRNKMKLGIVDEAHVLRLDRGTLTGSGLAVATVTARAAQPGPGGLAGINVVMPGGDKAPACSQAKDPLCDGRGYQNYTLEVVGRMGSDSFTPDSGVLLAKTKNADAAPFKWVIDANPQDINLVDYYKPDGTPVKVTVGDPRQLADALLKAGTGSKSIYEYTDTHNRLHFYVLDIKRDAQGVLSYTVAVRSLDGAGPHTRGVKLDNARTGWVGHRGATACSFPLTNTGKASGTPAAHLRSDVYRLKAEVSGAGWQVQLPNALATAKFGEKADVAVNVERTTAKPVEPATVKLTATSEADPSKTATATCTVLS
ncbi:M6 family metalloprotease domain-containing protein [Crossiella sp. CA-258035]|uniref:M6 family metalloprotease domain-containing protein n=1 Tax=Crossiella sp. CA-258035 TaxID=2981138 RepID=UPI0024BC8152|nr:M6 family metalloprotease domain-containing protein [Crossiella sp. CA-258035]WHT22169.1 M6 family metalloprotease domain-containing protein [Crossiella sp. CA-258035]